MRTAVHSLPDATTDCRINVNGSATFGNVVEPEHSPFAQLSGTAGQKPSFFRRKKMRLMSLLCAALLLNPLIVLINADKTIAVWFTIIVQAILLIDFAFGVVNAYNKNLKDIR